ncbi:MAG TPA: hypothetical protein PKY23_09105, partial [Bacillota bacterium]|nr:hypothetical protein [Bacillota bacterium]
IPNPQVGGSNPPRRTIFHYQADQAFIPARKWVCDAARSFAILFPCFDYLKPPEGEEIIKKEDIIACRQSVSDMLPREKKTGG